MCGFGKDGKRVKREFIAVHIKGKVKKGRKWTDTKGRLREREIEKLWIWKVKKGVHGISHQRELIRKREENRGPPKGD